MNWIVSISFAVFFIIFLYLYIINPDNQANSILGWLWEGACCLFFAIVCGGIFGGILAGIICFIGRSSLEKEERVSQKYDLVALDTNEDMHGSYDNFFFVGSGYIGEDIYYHFYYSTKNGVKYKKVRAENCFIIETSESPRYEVYGKYYKKSGSIFYQTDLVDNTKEVLYIPKGTIKNNYKVN